MKKKDLKTGMRVTLTNGREYIVVKDICGNAPDLFVDNNSYMQISSYDDDLQHKETPWSVSEIYNRPDYYGDLFNISVKAELLWSRD